MTIRRVDRQASPNDLSKMRTSHDFVMAGRFMGVMWGGLSC